jgi:hypothetical protein
MQAELLTACSTLLLACSTPPPPATPFDGGALDGGVDEGTLDAGLSDAGAPGSPAAGPCSTALTCSTGECVTRAAWPDGFCKVECTRDDECGADGVCVGDPDSTGTCFARCSDSGRRAGMQARRSSSGPRRLPPQPECMKEARPRRRDS